MASTVEAITQRVSGYWPGVDRELLVGAYDFAGHLHDGQKRLSGEAYITHPLAVAGVEPFASKLKAKPDEMVKLFEPADISIVVAGGETQGAWRMIGGAYRNKATVSVDTWR